MQSPTIMEYLKQSFKKDMKLATISNILLFGTILTVLLFIIDIQTPLGVADGMMYVSLVLLTLWLEELTYTLIAGIIASALIIAGYYLSPTDIKMVSIPVMNRVLSVVAIWAAVLFLYAFKRSEKKAELYKQRLSKIWENVEEGIIMTDKNQKIEFANPKIFSLSGYSPSELTAKNMHDLLLPLPENNNGSHIENTQLTNNMLISGKEYFFLLKRQNTESTPVAVHLSSFDTSGKPHYIFFIRDITERLRQKEKLRRANETLSMYAKELEQVNKELEERVASRTSELSTTVEELEKLNHCYIREIEEKQEAVNAMEENKRLLETIVQNYPNGIISIIDRDFRYLYAKGQELGNIGLTSDIVGSLFIPLRSEDQKAEIEMCLQKCFQGQTVSFEYCTPETKQFFLMNGVPLAGPGEEIRQLLLVSQNITTLKVAEENIKNALIKERQLNEVKSRFVTTASHEFRTPLATILTSTSLIGAYNNTEDKPKRDKHVDRINSCVKNLIHILNDFLSLGKIENGKVDVHPTDIVMNEFFEDLAEELRPASRPGQEIVQQNLLNEDSIRLDKQLLRNILINLLSNAIKYSPENSRIILTVKKENSNVIFSVKDHGMGIPESDQQHLFQTFFRASNVENIKGTGMGLHIVMKYIEIMNGNIGFESKVGEGSCFTVKLPINH
jgi:PAS domain S-box-containing protein